MNDDERLKRDEATVRRDFWRKLGKLRRADPVRRRSCSPPITARSTARTPTHVRVALIGALAYFISPLDLFPDVLPIVGFTDDAAVIAGAIKLVWDQHQARAPRRRARGAGADEQGVETT